MGEGLLNNVGQATAENTMPVEMLVQLANQEGTPGEAGEAEEAPPVKKPQGLSTRLRVALIAVATALLVPAIVWVMVRDTGPSEAVGVGTLLVMIAAFLVGTIASIAAIMRKERWGWATLAASIIVPLMWFSLLLLVASVISAISLP